ncbi:MULTISPECIES: hypothetical protein [Actinomadura]|uniref:Uncharacterized protein n=1 Tax=Actinomadura yumaensis TaxID=111807 RepID=A0ABW2D107_9ACTN|nr:hypothetical protein [Actinomadura sp. J1-007]MWK32723.1 hypothetical protein [Actinomadura sp. J1-007]
MTDTIEERLREAFDARAAAVPTHPRALADNRRRLRRAEIRRAALVPCVAAGAAAAVIVPFGAHALKDGDANALGHGDPGALVDPATVVRIPARLPDGRPFRVDALGPDGTVAGRTPDAQLWRADRKGGTPEALNARAQGGVSAGEGSVTWIAPGSYALECATAGRPRQVLADDAGSGRPVLMDQGTIAWNDVMDQPYVASGCAAKRRILPNHGLGVLGHAVALNGSTLFAADLMNDRVLREIDVRSGAIKAEHALPEGVRPNGKRSVGGSAHERGSIPPPVVTVLTAEQRWQAAATGRWFAWSVDGVLRVADRTTWRQVVRTARVPAASGAKLTAGDRLVVLSTGKGRSVLYDTATGETTVQDGEAYTAGGWLLWRDGGSYRLGRLR